jgi:hypothetical protein
MPESPISLSGRGNEIECLKIQLGKAARVVNTMDPDGTAKELLGGLDIASTDLPSYARDHSLAFPKKVRIESALARPAVLLLY